MVAEFKLSRALMLNIHLTKKTIIPKHFTGHQGCTYPTASLRNVLAKDQPNLTSASNFAHVTETTFLSRHQDNVFSNSFSNLINVNSQICLLPGQNWELQFQLRMQWAELSSSFPHFYICCVQDWYLFPSSLFPEQGKCNIYFQYAVFTFPFKLI